MHGVARRIPPPRPPPAPPHPSPHKGCEEAPSAKQAQPPQTPSRGRTHPTAHHQQRLAPCERLLDSLSVLGLGGTACRIFSDPQPPVLEQGGHALPGKAGLKGGAVARGGGEGGKREWGRLYKGMGALQRGWRRGGDGACSAGPCRQPPCARVQTRSARKTAARLNPRGLPPSPIPPTPSSLGASARGPPVQSTRDLPDRPTRRLFLALRIGPLPSISGPPDRPLPSVSGRPAGPMCCSHLLLQLCAQRLDGEKQRVDLLVWHVECTQHTCRA